MHGEPCAVWGRIDAHMPGGGAEGLAHRLAQHVLLHGGERVRGARRGWLGERVGDAPLGGAVRRVAGVSAFEAHRPPAHDRTGAFGIVLRDDLPLFAERIRRRVRSVRRLAFLRAVEAQLGGVVVLP